MKLVITAAAESDLLSIGQWIAEDNPARAISFIDELRQVCRSLAAAPRAYPIVERYRELDVRRRSYRDYLVFYRVSAEQIDILHVLHGARDDEAILSRSSE